jgi:hypothetical protein
MPDHPLLDQHLELLGLQKEGRVWATVTGESSGSAQRMPCRLGGERSPLSFVVGGRSTFISLEDAIVDRMNSLDSTGDLDSFNRALTLLGVVGIDHDRLESRASMVRRGSTVRVRQRACKIPARGDSSLSGLL